MSYSGYQHTPVSCSCKWEHVNLENRVKDLEEQNGRLIDQNNNLTFSGASKALARLQAIEKSVEKFMDENRALKKKVQELTNKNEKLKLKLKLMAGRNIIV